MGVCYFTRQGIRIVNDTELDSDEVARRDRCEGVCRVCEFFAPLEEKCWGPGQVCAKRFRPWRIKDNCSLKMWEKVKNQDCLA
jgi:hypothetical protein